MVEKSFFLKSESIPFTPNEIFIKPRDARSRSTSGKYGKRLKKYGIYMAYSFIWQKIWQNPKNMAFAIFTG
jgi:hypothetical protein